MSLDAFLARFGAFEAPVCLFEAPVFACVDVSCPRLFLWQLVRFMFRQTFDMLRKKEWESRYEGGLSGGSAAPP